MSSTAKTAPPQQPAEHTTKKKLGKNLNKLTKPPAPQAASSTKPNASRNGLLLLSTKRPSSVNSSVTASGGILSSKSSQTASKPVPSLGLQYESHTSTHDALMGAVVGASRAEAQQQPDAWGVAEKQQKTPVGDVDLNASENSPVASTPRSPPGIESDTPDQANDNCRINDGDDAVQSSNWDEYGGRNLHGGNYVKGTHENGDDSQMAFMSSLAKEKAEKLRVEEEKRQIAQRERATQRLRELEQNQGSAKTPISPEGPGSPTTPTVLEKLSRSQRTPEMHQARSPSRSDRTTQRTLYDPNHPYSSMVGSGGNRSDTKAAHQEPTSGRVGGGNYSPDPQSLNDSREPKYTRQPMIHLSSYEDRDRGERGTSTGPRMLFDPKSGSMVAVPTRDESSSNAKGRKERGRKGKNSKSDSRDGEGQRGKRGKQRRDDNGVRGKGNDSASPSKKGKVPSERRLPRTCGVLYCRGNKGGLVCSDGCDGDLGYGAHSVPGGRTRNQEAYAKYLEAQQQEHQDDIDQYETHLAEGDDLNAAAPEATLHTGFMVPEPTMDWLKPNEKIELITGIDDSPTLQATAKAWAPSQAALAAAAAGTDREPPGVPASVTSLDDNDDDEDDDAPLGLGFDPTLNMDSVMQSPSAEPASSLETMDLASLSLEPAMTSAAKSNHIFAFESGATWGTSNTATNNDWGMPTAAHAFSSSEDPKKGVLATSFLSLSSGNTWGGVPGLGAHTIGGTPVNRDPTRSTGD